jgi:hypothetical protein
MTKLISVLIIVLVVFLGYRLYVYWEKVESDQDLHEQQAAAKVIKRGDQLPGMPWELDQSLRAAQEKGPEAMRQWIATYGSRVEDPRLAWIQLDYCMMIARSSPNDARQIYARVADRVPTNSPVYPRLQQLSSTFK